VTRNALDFSYARPSADTILGVGINEVLVYCGNALPDQSYIDGLRSRGITVTYIMETVSTRSQQGFQAGVFDCQFAESRTKHQGHTGSIAVVVSDGNAADNWDASEYGRGWASVATLPFFAYGAVPICESFTRGAHGLCLGSWVPITWGQGTLISQLVTPSPIADTDLNIVHADYTVGHPAPPAQKDDDMPLYITKASDTSVGVWVTDSQTRRYVNAEEWAFAQFVGQKLVPIADDWWNSIPDINAVQAAQPAPGGALHVELAGTATPA
jgi:hypothetical protein